MFTPLSWRGRTAAERVYGSLADALGLAPWRAGVDTWQKLLEAHLAECIANAGYLQVAADAWVDASFGRLPAHLADARTPFALLRRWAEALDAATHDAMLSDRGLAATAAVVRAASNRQRRVQQSAEHVRAALGIATRDEIDGVHLEVQELKRALRRLAGKDAA